MSIYLDKKGTNITWLQNRTSDGESLPYQQTRNGSELAENLRFLERKTQLAAREIGYLDVYRFSCTVDMSQEFGYKFSQLANNTSLVINCEPFDFKGDTFRRGDVVIKNDEGQMLHIQATSKGIFYPYKISYQMEDGKATSNLATIEYRFAETIEQAKEYTQANGSESNGNFIWTASKPDAEGNVSYSATVLLPTDIAQAENPIYGQSFERPVDLSGDKWEFSLPKFKSPSTNAVVTPVVKCFIKEEEDGYEEIYCSPIFKDNEDKSGWVVKIPSFVQMVVVK